jgi:hypothetical protein
MEVQNDCIIASHVLRSCNTNESKTAKRLQFGTRIYPLDSTSVIWKCNNSNDIHGPIYVRCAVDPNAVPRSPPETSSIVHRVVV